MDLSKAIKTSCINLNMPVKSKNDILKEIARLVKTTEEAKNCTEKEIFKELKQREKMASTGFGNGIAIPHCSLDSITDFVIGVITIPNGADFDSIDESKVELLIFIVGPQSERNEHIRYLSGLSSILREKSNREKILHSKDAQEVKNILIGQSDFKNETDKRKDYNQFHIVVQDNELFDDVLELLTEIEDSYLTVIESNNVSSYLYRKPLFANLWESEEKSFSKLIVAVVRKNISNELIRKINLKIKNGKRSGLAFSVQDIIYFNGTIDI